LTVLFKDELQQKLGSRLLLHFFGNINRYKKQTLKSLGMINLWLCHRIFKK